MGLMEPRGAPPAQLLDRSATGTVNSRDRRAPGATTTASLPVHPRRMVFTTPSAPRSVLDIPVTFTLTPSAIPLTIDFFSLP